MRFNANGHAGNDYRKPGPGPPENAARLGGFVSISRLMLFPWVPYALALVATAAAALLRWWLGLMFGPSLPPFTTFYPAVISVALVGGLRPGLLATALSVLTADILFVPPIGLGAAHPGDQAGLVLFSGLNIALSAVGAAFRSARQRVLVEARRAQASEQRLLATFHQAALGILQLDVQDRITAANERACELLGFSNVELLGRSVHDLTHPDDRVVTWQLNRDLQEHRRPRLDYEKRYVRKDGTPIWVHVAVSPVVAADGAHLGAVGTFEDITQRKSAQDAQREQTQLAQFRADATQALQEPAALQELLGHVAVLLVERLDAAFARVWILNPADQTLELNASAGLYTHLNGAHARVPVGHLKIGRIAEQRRPLVTNQVVGDPHIPAQDWAQREGLVSFAGFPLLAEGRLVGVAALFARHYLSPAAVETFGAVAAALGQAVARMQSDAALLAEKDFSDRAINSLPGIFYLIDAERSIRRWNRNLETISGYSPQEISRLTAMDFIAPEDRPACAGTIARVLAEGEASTELLLLTKGGRRLPFLFTGRRLELPDQPGFIGVGLDISDRKRAEEALQRSEHQFRALVESIPQLVWTTDPNGQLDYTNDRWSGYCGQSHEESLGVGWASALHPDDRAAVLARWSSSIAAGTVFETQYRLRGKDGRYRWFLARGIPLRDAHGRVERWFGTCTDVDDQKRTLEALHAAREDLARTNVDLERVIQRRTANLREAVAELEGFSYSLVHDLRAPLRAMLSYASIIETEAAPRLQTRESDLLRKLKTAALRMDQLVTDSLNYSRILRQDLPLAPLNLGALIRGIVETYPNLHAANAEIRVDLGDLFVHGNPAALTQVFSNLLGNAVKFVAPGVRPRIRVWAQLLSAANHVLVWVEDNGIGIPKEAHESIFGMFQRMHRAEEYPGTGIGLAIVKKSVERSGGRVCVDSELGKGSRFVVELPLAAPMASRPDLPHAA